MLRVSERNGRCGCHCHTLSRGDHRELWRRFFTVLNLFYLSLISSHCARSQAVAGSLGMMP